MDKQREIPSDDNEWKSLGELLDWSPHRQSIATLATAIETYGIYTWDRFGRFRRFDADSEYGKKALDLLAYVYEYENNPEPGYKQNNQHPAEQCSGWDNPYSRYGWAKKATPDFNAIQSANPDVGIPETTARRRLRIMEQVDTQKAKGVDKTVSFKAMAKIEGCGPDNIERIYKDGKKANRLKK